MPETTLEKEISAVLNCHSAENGSDTPDFILAQYLLACLAAFDAAAKKREVWYGRATAPCTPPVFHCEEAPCKEVP